MIRVLASLVLLFVLTPAHATIYGAETETPPGQEQAIVHPITVANFLAHAMAVSRYAVKEGADLPTAYIMEREWFVKNLCRGNADCPTVGAYFPSNPNSLFLRADRTPEQMRSTLVHELIHWLQKFNGFEDDFSSCPNVAAHEAEAYAATYLYRYFVEHTRDGFEMPDYSCRPKVEGPFGVIDEPKIEKGAVLPPSAESK